MHVRCPHCRNPIEIVGDETLTDISCPSCGSQFHLAMGESTASSDDLPPKIGRFELIERVGSGRFGVVFKARDPELARIVALKVSRREQLDDGGGHQFIREVRRPR